MRNFNIIALIVALVFVSACTNSSSSTKGSAAMAKLTSDQIYKYENRAGMNESYVKFVVFVNDKDLSLEFFDSNTIKLHVEFLKTVKGVTLSAEEIYKLARFNEGRKYFFGALIKNYNPMDSKETVSYQITAEDPLSVEDIVRVGNLVRESLEEPPQLHYMPSGNQSKNVSDLAVQQQLELAGFPVLQIDAFKSKTYFAAIVPGRLKKVTAKEIEDGTYHIQGDEVLLLDHVPDSLPPVRGVITSLPTSPSSHVSLLANMYSIPFVYVQNAVDLKDLNALDGQSILFKTYASGYGVSTLYLAEALKEQDYKEIEASWLNRFPKVTVKVDDKNLNELNTFPLIGANDKNLNVGTCGAKASNGDLLVNTIGSKNSIEGFCIPFYFFNKFMMVNKVGSGSLKEYIQNEIQKITSQTKLEDVHATLLKIKEQIAMATIPADDMASIKKMVVDTYSNKKDVKKIRFRSSSNAEDDERFNGAGLYESDGLKLEHVYANNDKKIDESLKIVWSSLYGLRAVMARKMFKIDESMVNMGILVNQAFEETANGVSICQYPYASSDTLNCMIEGYPGGELSVAHPAPGSTTEIIKTQANEHYPFGVMDNLIQTTSELEQFERLLAPKEFGELFKLQEKVYTYWSTNKKANFRGTLDFEWKRMQESTTGESYMALKQVREVPTKLAFGLSEPKLVLPSGVEFTSGGLDGSANLEALFTWRKVRLEIPKFTAISNTAELKANAKIFTDDFSGLNIPLPIQKVQYIESKWTVDASAGGEQRFVQAVFTVKHPKHGDVKISLGYDQLRDAHSLLSDNVMDRASTTVTASLVRSQITNNKKHKDLVEVDLENEPTNKFVEAQTTNFCIKGEIIASTVETMLGGGIYYDGTSNMDSATLTKKAFKALKSEIVISQRHELVSSYDSHAFEAGQYMSLRSAYIAPKAAKAAGLKEEDYFVVFAKGVNYEAEEPLDDLIILYNSKREVVEKRKLSLCPGEEEVPEEDLGEGEAG